MPPPITSRIRLPWSIRVIPVSPGSGSGSRTDREVHSRNSLQLADDHEQVAGARIAFRAQHAHQTFRRGAGLACKLFKANRDRKSTRLNSSHSSISYAVFCLK